MYRLFLYITENCPLCDQAEVLLMRLQGEYSFTVEAVDIAADADLWQRYRHAVPVVVLGDGLTVEAPVTEARLRWALNRVPALRTGPAAQPQVSGRLRDFIIALDRVIFWFARHWLLVFNVLLALYVGLPLLAPVLMASGDEGPARLIYTVYKPMCHQLPWRTFFLSGEQLYYDYDYLVLQVGEEPLATLWDAKDFVGTPQLGFKMALCERDMAIYGSMLLAGVLFGLLRRRLKPLPWLFFVLFVLPLAVDGAIQLIGLHESTPLLRLITGSLFGLGTIWLAYPYIEAGMNDVRQELERKFKWT